MIMNTNEERGFWRKAGDWLNGYPTEIRTGTVEPTAGEVSPLSGVIPPARLSYDDVTPETAMEIGTVFRAVDIISTSVSQLEVGVYRNGIEIPAPALIKQPDINQSPSAFYQETVISLALWGNAYWRIYGEAGSVQSLAVLDPNTVNITLDKNGKKVYQVGNETLDASKVKHLKHTRLPGADYGIGPVQQGKNEIRAAMMLRKFQNQWFDTRVVPTGVLTTDLNLSAEEAADYAAAWEQFLAQHGGIAVLSQGLSYQTIALKPAEAQFLEVQEANDKNIARIFGVPVVHLNVEIGGTSFTYMNMEQLIILFYQTTLIRYINEIELALSDLLPRGQKVSFKEEGLLRTDTVTKWNIIEKQVGIGYTSGEELRELEGKAPLPTTAMPKANPVTDKEETTDEPE